MANNGGVMKGWRGIVGALIISCLMFFAITRSTNTSEQFEDNLNAESIVTSGETAPPKGSELETSETNSPKTKDWSVTELSELSKQYIVQCKDQFAFLDGYSDESVQEMQNRIFEIWSRSNEFEQQLAIALIHTNLKAITLNGLKEKHKYEHKNLSQLVKDFPDSNLAHYFLVAHCSEQDSCDNSVFDIALAQDPYNGALWKLMAIRYASAGEVELALSAIQNSNTAVNYDSYWGETIHLFEQALATTVEMDERNRQIAAIGFSAALVLPSYKTLLDFCREHSAHRADIANACLRMGARQFQSGDNLFEQNIGLAIQKLVYEEQNSSLEAEKVESQIQEFRSTTAKFAIGPNLALHDKSLNKYWWENISLYGETKALQLTYAEAVRLSSDPSYDPCPNGKIEPETISNQ
jgi:hypothetical protein